jgi:tetratricopeptide (TPR) repeat protein
MPRPAKLLEELWRRKVIRAGIAYAVSAWLIVQIAAILLRAYDAPGWVMQVLVAALVIGMPVALVFSWFFDVSVEGIKRTEKISADEFEVPKFDRRTDFVIIGLLAAALLVSLYGNLRGPAEQLEPVSILIADFENETGSDLFSGVLEDTLRIGLEVAPFIDTYSRKTAASMSASVSESDADSTNLDLEEAGLVALREGFNIVIGGLVQRRDGRLEVAVTGVSPADQRELFATTESAATDADILSTIAKISKNVRLALGDTEKPFGAGAMESFAVANLEAAAEYLKAQDLQLDRKLEEAVIHYEKALELDPDFARAYAGLALTEQYLGNSEAATKNWQETLSRLDNLTERGQLRTLGNYYMINQRDYDKALETYGRLVEKYPADNVAQNNLAVTAFYAMDFGRALQVGRDVADRFPNHSGYRANLALFAMYATRFDEASDEAQRVIDVDPSSAYAYFVLAVTNAAAGKVEAAEDIYQRMTKLDQFGRSIATEGLADLAIYRGDVAAAVAILDDAIKEEFALNANHTAAIKQVMRAEALLLIGEREMAQSSIDAALQHANGDPAILVPAALTLVNLGDTDRAEAIAAEMSGSFALARRTYANAIRAQIAFVRGDPTTAIELASAALDTSDLWHIRLMRGKFYFAAGLAAEAASDFQICQQRIGEGIAVFLNDRPSLRQLRDLEAAVARIEDTNS